MKKMKQILFLGAPGVGKGTYARRVAPWLRFAHISPGDFLRKESGSNPEIKKFLDHGKLVPEQVVFDMMRAEITRVSAFSEGAILDGFPRSKEQALGWISRSNGSIPDLVVEFHLPEKLLIEKLLGRRVCSGCGDLYNVYSFNEGEYRMPAMLPKMEGICDKCGCPLVNRSDDNLDVIRDRLHHHWNEEKKLIEYLASLTSNIARFDVKTGIAQMDELVSLIQNRLV